MGHVFSVLISVLGSYAQTVLCKFLLADCRLEDLKLLSRGHSRNSWVTAMTWTGSAMISRTFSRIATWLKNSEQYKREQYFYFFFVAGQKEASSRCPGIGFSFLLLQVPAQVVLDRLINHKLSFTAYFWEKKMSSSIKYLHLLLRGAFNSVMGITATSRRSTRSIGSTTII